MVNYPAIKLYSKTSLTFKCKDINDINDTCAEVHKKFIFFTFQEYKPVVKQTLRKTKPLDLEITFYELETIKEMIEDKIVEVNKNGR